MVLTPELVAKNCNQNVWLVPLITSVLKEVEPTTITISLVLVLSRVVMDSNVNLVSNTPNQFLLTLQVVELFALLALTVSRQLKVPRLVRLATINPILDNHLACIAQLASFVIKLICKHPKTVLQENTAHQDPPLRIIKALIVPLVPTVLIPIYTL